MNIVLVQPKAASGLRRAVGILREEIEKRVGSPVSVTEEIPAQGAWIALGLADELTSWSEPLSALDAPGAEGYRVLVLSQEPVQAVVCGSDERGLLYGCGYMLRKMDILPGLIKASAELKSCSVTPKYPLRGHQLAYRDKQNTCPNWTVADFDQYIRELALFGSNAIEILPPHTDDPLFSPLFKMHPLEMMVRLSEIIHGYGLDVWVWYPNLAEDYSDPKQFQKEIKERETVFSAVPYVDAILIPAGDPGELQPREFFEVSGSMMAVAHRYHPNAKVFVAPQVFAPEYDWYENFYQEITREPEWLYGVSYAPWIGDTLPEMVSRLPDKYKNRVRHYPDITHTASCQFEVPLWDSDLAFIHGRESCCPRPVGLKAAHNAYAPYCMGSLTYCEGIHDDVNKFLWTDQDVDPTRSAESLVRDYVRAMIDPAHVDELTDLIFALEKNWEGALATNERIDETFARFEALDAELRDEVRNNWRYRMLYQRAMLDLYAKRRYIADQQLEKEAREELAKAKELGVDNAIRKARSILNRSLNEPTAEDLRFRLQELSQKLFTTPFCRMQQSVVMHRAQAWVRGAWVDGLNAPMNDTQYFKCWFDRILALTDEDEKLETLNAVLNRTDAGEDGKYIALGKLADFQKYVVNDTPWEQDPGVLRSPHLFHDVYGMGIRIRHNRGWHNEYPIPQIWIHQARTIYGTPLTVRVDGLKPGAMYVLKVTYPEMLAQTKGGMKVALTANGQLIHDLIPADTAVSREPVYTYPLPQPVGEDGVLTLVWRAYDRLFPTGVSELWLIRA